MAKKKLCLLYEANIIVIVHLYNKADSFCVLQLMKKKLVYLCVSHSILYDVLFCFFFLSAFYRTSRTPHIVTRETPILLLLYLTAIVNNIQHTNSVRFKILMYVYSENRSLRPHAFRLNFVKCVDCCYAHPISPVFTLCLFLFPSDLSPTLSLSRVRVYLSPPSSAIAEMHLEFYEAKQNMRIVCFGSVVTGCYARHIF